MNMVEGWFIYLFYTLPVVIRNGLLQKSGTRLMNWQKKLQQHCLKCLKALLLQRQQDVPVGPFL